MKEQKNIRVRECDNCGSIEQEYCAFEDATYQAVEIQPISELKKGGVNGFEKYKFCERCIDE